MAEPNNPLTAAYSRGRDQDWKEQAQQNHRQWRRRSLTIGSGAAAVGLVVLFIVYDYPRESGLTDAMGLTCGEYVHPGEPADADDPYESWDLHLQTLTAEQSLDVDAFLSAVDSASGEVDAEPVLGHFRGRSTTQRQHSEAVVGDQLMLGHHEEFWTGTDRVSLYDPAAAQITWTAQTIHPVRDHHLADESRPRVLYGVGASDSQIVLQTPTHRGDTDLVVVSNPATETECHRLEGGADTQQILSAQQGRVTAWSQVIDLSAGQVGEDEFLIHHGHSEDSPEHQISVVDLATGESEPTEMPLDLPRAEASPVEIAAEAQQLSDEDFESLQPLGEEHYLLTWEAGSIILQRH